VPTELNLRFPKASHVIVRLGEEESGELPFTNPIADKDLRDLAWYVETYGAHSLGDPDDREAARITGLLREWGKKLFDAVFTDREAQRLFNAFQDAEGDSRLLTISAEHPAILALPWELLHFPASGGVFLFMETPRISIRRRVAGATGGRKAFKPAPKDALHLLFLVSRPADTGFLDPRADSQPVLEAIDQHAPGRVTWEFLRPPTLDALIQRLEDKTKTPVDILHFDGHGVFDRHGNLPNRAAAETVRIARPEEILRDKKVEVPVDPDCPANTGYLLFEKPDGSRDFVSAPKLGENLHRHQVALVILSACQSAAIGGEEKKADGQPDRPMGSVAARLTATGIPSVLAMTHSVLVATTRALFGEFYKELARHKGIGEALDNARRHLANHPEKYDVQRGPDRVKLKLYDWFLPALYQQGADVALLNPLTRPSGTLSPSGGETAGVRGASSVTIRTNLPKAPEAGFFGRKRKLWEIERGFAGATRRITLTGFGGQGKTALAQEAGRWLTRTGLFQAAVFVDYSRVQAADAVSVAKNEIGTVLDQTFIDATAATAALKQTPTLVILDNLEALAPDSLRALLDAAVPWSEAGGSRVLCTTRQPDFGHAAYRVGGTNIHLRLPLDGLGSKAAPDDALEWCAALMILPPAPTASAPKREALIELFDRVKFHPLSIRVLAQQLKTRRMAELGERLEQLLGSAGVAPTASKTQTLPATGSPLDEATRRDAGAPQDEDTPAGLLASLELSLDKLDEAARQVLPRLGVFQGGAFEDDLCVITGLGDPHAGQRQQLKGLLAAVEAGKGKEIFRAMGQPVPNEAQLRELVASLRAELAELPPAPVANLWPGLRRQLEAAALLEAEDVPGVTAPFLRFHPTLAPMLWARLDAAERERLTTALRQRYYALSGYLYREDDRNPHQARDIAWRELPNLLHAVHAALDAGDPDAGMFVSAVNLFLGFFGLKQEAERLSKKAQAAAPDAGSRAWHLAQSNRGEQLFAAGQVPEAAQVFQAILQQLGDTPTYERAMTLGHLGRCFCAGGRPDLAAQSAREAVSVCDKLEPSDGVKRHRGVMLTDLADALAGQGKFAEAWEAYQEALKVAEELSDPRHQGVVLGQLGTLAMREGKLAEAADRYRAALALFQQLREPKSEAVAWHQLGMVFEKARQWDEAERHFRESARIEEERGHLAAAAQTWNQLAIVSKWAGKPDAAELWYRKAIEGGRKHGDLLPTSRAIANLAGLLLSQPGRLAEARQLAEEALAIKQTLDPGAAEIWNTYSILAQIAEQEALGVPPSAGSGGGPAEAGTPNRAREYRRLAREAKRNFAGTRHELRQFAPVILATVAACAGRAEGLQAVKQFQLVLAQNGPEGVALSRVLDRILAGERDEAALCEGLQYNAGMIIDAILAGLRDPQTLADLLPSEPSKAE
jgi:tetratricopeptide (TPR) repeat protein